VESLTGAEAAHLARPDEVGSALGALRFWRPIGVMAVALAGTALIGSGGVGRLLIPVTVLQALAVAAALLIHEGGASGRAGGRGGPPENGRPGLPTGKGLGDGVLWVFVVAMVLFHLSAAPGGAYLALFLQEDLKAPDYLLPVAFIVMMLTWMLVTRPAGQLADRIGRRPLLIAGWGAMALRLGLTAVAREPWQVLALEVLDGLAQGLFAVMAAAWVTDRLADPRRVGEAQVLVGSALVLGSALGPLLAGLVIDSLGFRGTFALLAGVAAVATAIVVARVPETVPAGGPHIDALDAAAHAQRG
jgi:MFS_1 like family